MTSISSLCRMPDRPALPKILSGTPVDYDPSRPNGGLPMKKMENIPESMREEIAKRDAAIESLRPPSATEKIAARDEAARQQDPAARYQAALGFGPDFVDFMNGNINVADKKGYKDNSNELKKAHYEGHTSTCISAQGTIIGVDRISEHPGKNEKNTIQITRKDGFQINLELNDDLRINDLDDGSLSIYYASTGISRIFDAEGKETTIQGEKNVLGTSGDDIIINTFSKRVEAGDGDDTIINFGDNVEILGGAGDDNIFLHSYTTNGVNIDGGAGNDVIVGYEISESNIIMNEGDDQLSSMRLTKSNIVSSGNDTIKTQQFHESQLTHRNGLISIDFADILESSLTIDRVKPLSTGLIRRSNITFKNGDVFLNTLGIAYSNVTTGSGNDRITTLSIHDSTLNTGDGNDIIKNKGCTDDSSLNTGNGVDTIIFEMSDRHVSVSGAENIERHRY